MAAQELESLLIKILGDATGLQKAMKAAEQTVKMTTSAIADNLHKVGSSMRSLGKTMTATVTAPIVAGLSASVYAFAGFNDSLTKSTSIMGTMSEKTRGQLKQTALTLSGESVFSAKQMADAYYFLASAGMTAAESIAALPHVNRFAIAGAFDLATATDLLTDAQSALGMNVGTVAEQMRSMVEISDVLVGANTLANASVEQFSQALTHKAAAALKTYGKSVQEGVAVLTVMADQGTKGAEAGIQLDRLTRLMTGANNANQESFKRLGFAVFDANGEMRNYADIIENVTTSTAHMTPEVRSAELAALGFDARIQGVLLPLLGTANAIRINQYELERMAGITQEVADKQLVSFSNQMKIVWNQITNVAIAIGDKLAPWIVKLGKTVKSLLKWWGQTSDAFQNTVIVIAIVVAAIGPLIFAFGTLFIAAASYMKIQVWMELHNLSFSASTILNTITTAARTVATWLLSAAQWALNAAMAAMPYALALAGIAAMVVGIYKLNKGVKDLNKEQNRLNKLNQDAVEIRDAELKKEREKINASGKEGSRARVTMMEKALIKSQKAAQDLKNNIKRGTAAAEELAPTMWSLGQWGKSVYEEQINKMDDLRNRLELEKDHREELMEQYKKERKMLSDSDAIGMSLGGEANALAEEVKALEDLNKELIEQKETFGMTASEIQIYRARLKGADDTMIHSLVTTQLQNDALMEEIKILEEEEAQLEKREQLYKDMNESMDQQIATMNMTTAEVDLYKASLEGLSDVEMMILKIKSDKLVKMKEEKKLMDEGERLTKAMRKPAEKLADGQEKLKEMLELGAISVETYGRAMDKLEKDMQVKVSFSISGIDAVASGSLEAMARIEEFRALAAEPNKVDFREQGQAIVDAPAIAAEEARLAAIRKKIEDDFAAEQAKGDIKDTIEWKQKNTPFAAVDSAQAGLEWTEGRDMTVSDLPSGVQMNEKDEAEAERRQAEHLESIKIPLPEKKSQAQLWQEREDAKPDKKPVYMPDVHSVFSGASNTADVGSGGESGLEKENKTANEVTAEATTRIADALENTTTAGFN